MSLVKCKECGEKVSTKAKTCPNCGAKPPKKTSLLTWFVLFTIIIVLINAANMTPEEKELLYQESAAREDLKKKEQESDRSKKIEADCRDSTMAFIKSQRYVKNHLKSPTSADFPGILSDGVKTKYIGNCTHEIWAYVDATNSFGATLRSDYYLKIQNNKGTNTWSPLDFKM
jgi:RNA polymerase subunit RPABC4/transcription elongation factor Spt4